MAIHRTAALAFCLVALASTTASAYPGGTPAYVTDVAPYCASCHSSASEDQLQGMPPARASAELAANKHLAKIRTPAAGLAVREAVGRRAATSSPPRSRSSTRRPA